MKEVKDSSDTDMDAEKLTADKMKKKIEAIRWRRVLQDVRGEAAEASVRLGNETNPIEVVDILVRMSTTAAEDVTFNRSPILNFTAGISYDVCVKSSKALYGLAAKGRLSMWQFRAKSGAWRNSWYCSLHVTSSRHMMSSADCKALGCEPADIRDFEDAGNNYQLWLREVANTKLAQEVEEMVRILVVYYHATLPTVRLKKCTVALLFDLVDFMMDLSTDFLTEQADCQRAKRSSDVTFDLMTKRFPDLCFT